MKNTYSEVLQALRRAPMEMTSRLFKKRRDGKISVSELLSLYIIDVMDGPTLKEYAQAMGISQPNATYKIKTISEKGYVEKRSSTEDRRETNLYLTEKGRNLFLETGSEGLELELTHRFSEQELEIAGKVFETIVKFYSGKI